VHAKVVFVGVAAVLLFGLAACGGAEELRAERRTVYMAAVEPKGSTTVAKEPFPAKALPDGGGYGLEGPDASGTWTVETYQWSPGTVTVVEGDRVRLEILGVNGPSHPATIEGYGVDFEVKRGQLTRVEFDAKTPGIFRIVCKAHTPAMTGSLVVLPRG
jgi:plastocyanin